MPNTPTPEQFVVTVLPPCNRGRNARGTCGHKRGWGGSQPKGAKRAKKQNTLIRGAQPAFNIARYGTIYGKEL